MHALWHTTHHGNHRQPRLLVALSACDHGLIPVFRAWFSPLVQESWRVGYPACWFTPPRFRSRRSGSPNDRLSSGQHTVSCPPGRRTTLRIHNTSQPTLRPAWIRRESSSYRVVDERQGDGASPFQSFGQILNPKYILSSDSMASDQVLVRCICLVFSSCLSACFSPSRWNLPHVLERCYSPFAYDFQ